MLGIGGLNQALLQIKGGRDRTEQGAQQGDEQKKGGAAFLRGRRSRTGRFVFLSKLHEWIQLIGRLLIRVTAYRRARTPARAVYHTTKYWQYSSVCDKAPPRSVTWRGQSEGPATHQAISLWHGHRPAPEWMSRYTRPVAPNPPCPRGPASDSSTPPTAA